MAEGFVTIDQFKAANTAPFRFASLRTMNASREQITDARLDQLGQRFTSNHTFELMGLAFAEYIESPDQYDRIARDMANAGKCRVVAGALVPSHG
jgi:hypothetical protein